MELKLVKFNPVKLSMFTVDLLVATISNKEPFLSDMYDRSRHTVASVPADKKTKEDMQHTSVLFTGTIKLPNSAFCISKTTESISTKFIYFLPYTYSYITSHIKILRKSLQHFMRYLFLKIAQFSSHISSSYKITNIFKLHKNNLPMFRFLSNLEH